MGSEVTRLRRLVYHVSWVTDGSHRKDLVLYRNSMVLKQYKQCFILITTYYVTPTSLLWITILRQIYSDPTSFKHPRPITSDTFPTVLRSKLNCRSRECDVSGEAILGLLEFG